jgi:RNA polymerase sigma-70 factor, ECF subfamily
MARDTRALNDETPEALLVRISAGSESALEVFYHRFQARIFRYANARVNDPFEAADILNEVMMEVWRRANSFQGRSKVSTWLFGIARHKACDRLRARHPEAMDGSECDLVDDTISMDEALSAAEDAHRVRECLKTLSTEHREVLHLAFFEDMHYTDIAAIVGVRRAPLNRGSFTPRKR